MKRTTQLEGTFKERYGSDPEMDEDLMPTVEIVPHDLFETWLSEEYGHLRRKGDKLVMRESSSLLPDAVAYIHTNGDEINVLWPSVEWYD